MERCERTSSKPIIASVVSISCARLGCVVLAWAASCSVALADARTREPPRELLRPRVAASVAVSSGRDPEVADWRAGAPEGDLLALRGALELEVALLPTVSASIAGAGVWARHVLLDGTDESRGGAGDLSFGLRFTPIRGRHRLSLDVSSRVSPYPRLSASEVERGVPQQGPGGVDVVIGGSWRYSICPAWWTGVTMSLVLRLGGPSSGARTRIELGRTLFGPIALGAFVFGQPAYGTADEQPLDAPAPIPRRVAGGAFLSVLQGAFFATIEGSLSVLEDTRGLEVVLSAGRRVELED